MQIQSDAPCPFCAPDSARVFLRLRYAFALWDGFPVSDGHALIVPYRHVPTWFDANDSERAELFGALDSVCALIRQRHGAVEDFNFGINSGPAAGQTVPHLHLHVIPRRHGDVPDPRGGVRHVIPGKGNYLPASVGSDLSERSAVVGSDLSERFAPVGSDLSERFSKLPILTTGESNPLFPHLTRDIAHATRVDIAVAFVMPSGVERMYAHFDDLLGRGGSLRLITGDYMGISDPDALQRLLDLKALHGETRVELRIFASQAVSFHPKSYLLTRDYAQSVAYVGSSNLSGSALTDGIEWNHRIPSNDALALAEVRKAFDSLIRHPSVRPLDAEWLDEYRKRRPTLIVECNAPDATIEPALPTPDPNEVQTEALEALALTRAAGAKAGLVVLATGLGKTWLAAFDVVQAEAKRVLFVAHREEILDQALATFRRIRPGATLGLYNGTERATDAQILFASIQTLSRQAHLDRFDRQSFDYIVVDEFHHAAAGTYRRLIAHFEPEFLLGLTATPERTDGGDLLGLCGENLVYRCGVPRGIALELLCAYRYFGVPDDVDYANIPWRSSRFDEIALTEAVATTRRADNILEQWRKRGGDRTIAFCVSQRHADYMRDWFQKAGIACASVHSGPLADPRARSLERLAAGELKVVFAVDMFNEGVDVPTIDTVMMLRPTESAIVWLQQFGRGLRRHGDKRLTVIDYIGNHRSFLLKVRALLAVDGAGSAGLRAALDAYRSGLLDLPPGCEVTYDLETLDILSALLPPPGPEPLRDYYIDYRDRHGERPTASQTFHDGYLPGSARGRYGSWFGFVEAMGDAGALGGSGHGRDASASASATAVDVSGSGHGRDASAPASASAADVSGNGHGRDASALAPASANPFPITTQPGLFLKALETTPMTRSYKMLVLQAMLDTDTLVGGGIDITTLTHEFARIAQRTPILRADVGPAIDDPAALRKHIETNPINAWTGTGALGGPPAFSYADDVFRYIGAIPTEHRDAFQLMVRELVDWRLAEYLTRASHQTSATGFVMRVKHTNGKPILFLPDRDQTPAIPAIGWHTVSIDGVLHQANFVKIAINVLRPEGRDENVLPKILRAWFGPNAGLPGTDFKVSCELIDGEWIWKPLGQVADEKLELFRRYSREQIPRFFGEQFNPATWNSGVVLITPDDPKIICLLVNIDREGMGEQFQYKNRFLAPDLFQWQSQNQTRQDSKHGRLISQHEQLGVQVHLFIRAAKKQEGAPVPFLYCGDVTFEIWEGNEPITVNWQLQQALPKRLVSEFA